MKGFPIILVGGSFWDGLVDWLEDKLLTLGLISPEDTEIFYRMDDVDEIVNFVKRTVVL